MQVGVGGSHGLVLADHLEAVGAGVVLVVEGGDAEGDAAAAEPAANEAEHEAKDPGEGALVLLHVGHASVVAELAGNHGGLVGPLAEGESALLAGDYHDLGGGGDRLSVLGNGLISGVGHSSFGKQTIINQDRYQLLI